ncbi:MAG: c-type cytochrome [Candidatus Marinimicrobia bacterium]|nr:c-type cytochrome [Candidatus Neomarinimicrobiota bacterium]MCF7903588.1 c-type cytochrome [Candidatus Neomarinimicrobiota bacterium]
MGKASNKLIEHDFDGIQEYDNDLPGWWKALFLITVIFSIIYVPYYHLAGDLQEDEYAKETGTYEEHSSERSAFTSYSSPYSGEVELTPALIDELEQVLDAPFDEQLMRSMSKADADQLEKLKAAFPDVYEAYASGGAPEPAPAATETAAEDAPAEDVEVLTDAASLAAGKKIWDTQCFTCHLNDGGGSIGPNMTDNYWIHGGDMASIIHIINVGVPAKGMIPWSTTLTAEEIHQVASYIQAELVGSTPAVAKDPQGELYDG